MKYFLLIIFLLLTAFTKAFPQVESGQSLDKIVAVVGKEIIMLSDIMARIEMLKQQGISTTPSGDDLYETVLNAAIDEKLIITKALEDSLTATDEEINLRWDALIQNLVRQFGSEKRIEDVYGMTLSRLKYQYRSEIRNNILSEKITQQKFGSLKVSPKEVEEFYKDYKDSLGTLPAQVELFHIVRYVQVNTKSKDDKFELAKRIRDSIISGGDFAEFAKRYSDDPGSAEDGGELGWFKKGQLLPEYEESAFNLQVGEISEPVETPFGFHIIETLDKKKDEVLTRHILLKIGQSEEDKENTREFLSELKNEIEEGASFDEYAKKYSEDKETKGFGGFIGKFELNKLPIEFRQIIEKLEEGEISEPKPYSADPSKSAYHIVYKKRIIPEHTPDLESDYDKLEQLAQLNKRQKLYQRWLGELREELYWEIKE